MGRSVRRWYRLFKTTGHVIAGGRVKKHTYAPELLEFINGYVKEHPTFYIEEFQAGLRNRFTQQLSGLSASTLLRVLRFELKLFWN